MTFPVVFTQLLITDITLSEFSSTVYVGAKSVRVTDVVGTTGSSSCSSGIIWQSRIAVFVLESIAVGLLSSHGPIGE